MKSFYLLSFFYFLTSNAYSQIKGNEETNIQFFQGKTVFGKDTFEYLAGLQEKQAHGSIDSISITWKKILIDNSSDEKNEIRKIILPLKSLSNVKMDSGFSKVNYVQIHSTHFPNVRFSEQLSIVIGDKRLDTEFAYNDPNYFDACLDFLFSRYFYLSESELIEEIKKMRNGK